MEFPAPPGYAAVLYFRLLLSAWAIVGLGLVIMRWRRLKSVTTNEISRWALSAGLSTVVALTGANCRYELYDDNSLLLPIFAANLAVSVAGITICLYLAYVDGTDAEKRGVVWGVLAASAIISACGWLLLMPSTSQSPEAFHRRRCKNNLKQIGYGLHSYSDVNNSTFLPAVSGTPPVSWRVSLLPYLDEKPVYSKYDLNAEWDTAPNAALSFRTLDCYSCPSNYHMQDPQGRQYTCYSMLTGPNAIGGNTQGTKFEDISDGLSNTIIVVEACGAEIVWTEPRDVDISLQAPGINLKGNRPGQSAGWISSYHTHGTNVLFADGSVRFLSSNIEPQVLVKLCNYANGQPPGDY